MKTWTLRFRAVDKKNLMEIRDGLKSIETRAATEKYRDIKRGDTLILVCGKQRIERVVGNLKIFKTINALFQSVPFRKIMPSAESEEEARNIYYSYPGYREKIRKYGIIAMTVRNSQPKKKRLSEKDKKILDTAAQRLAEILVMQIDEENLKKKKGR